MGSKKIFQTELFIPTEAELKRHWEKVEAEKDYFFEKYTPTKVENKNGTLRHFEITIGPYEFRFDLKGFKFFINKFDDETVFVHNGYLAKKVDDRIYYFHREFKMGDKTYEGYYVVHHKNFRKTDNRNANLIIMTEKEHEALHDGIYEEKRKKREVKRSQRRAKQREKTRKSNAYKTFRRKFFESRPDTSIYEMSASWTRFKQRHGI